MRINNNMMALNTHRQLGISNLGAAKGMEKLSSGFRINRAGDDAAGLAISEKMRGQIRGLNMASRNAQDTISLIQTAEGALGETQAVLQRMRELAVQSANDTNTDADRVELQAEVHQLKAEIDRIANSTEFNTRKLLEGSAKGVAEEVMATARLNNNSNIAIDSFRLNAMMESVGSDRSWTFDGAFMLIKTNQTYDSNNAPVYNANDYSIVGPDGTIYQFVSVGVDTSIKASELKDGNIIADGGANIKVDSHLVDDDILNPAAKGFASYLVKESIISSISQYDSTDTTHTGKYADYLVSIDTIPNVGAYVPGTHGTAPDAIIPVANPSYMSIGLNDPDLANGIHIGKSFTDIELFYVAADSVLGAGSSFTLRTGGSVYFGDPATGAVSVNYDDKGLMSLTTLNGKTVEIGVGKTITLDDGTILRNNGGGKVTVESGGLRITHGPLVDSTGNPLKHWDTSVTPPIPDAASIDDLFKNGARLPETGEWANLIANGVALGLVPGLNVSSFFIASQSFLSENCITAKDDVTLVVASNYSVVPGVLGTNVTIGNSMGLNGFNTTNAANGDGTGDIAILNEGSILARGSVVEMLQVPGRVTSIRINVEGNDLEISYNPDAGILKVGDQVVAPGKSITLDDGTILTHCADLDAPNTATGKFIVDTGRIKMSEKLSADTLGVVPPTNPNVLSFMAAKDSVLTAGTILDSARDPNSNVAPFKVGTPLMAGTVITSEKKVYPGSVTLGHGGTNIQFSSNVGASLAARYYETKVGETLTFVFSRYEPAGNSLRDSIMTQIGANSGQTAFISMGDMRARALNVADMDVSTKFGAATGIETVNNALQRVSHQRAILGAMQNRLEHSIKSLDSSAENLQAAESRIRDADMAKEIMEYTKNSILQQSAQAMLAQANQVPQNVLQLLR